MKDIRTDRGTAAQSGAGDLALVGVVPAAFGMSAPADATDVRVSPSSTSRETIDRASDASANTVAGSDLVTADTSAAMAGALQPTLLAAASGSVDARPVGPARYGAEGGADMLHSHIAFDGGQEGQDMPIPAAVLPDIPEASTAAGAAAAPAPVAAVPLAADLATIETIRATVATLQEAIGALGARIEGGEQQVAGVVADANDTIAALDASLADVAAGAATTVGEIAAQADDLIAGAASTVGNLTGAAASQAAATVAHVGADVAGLSDTAAATLGDVASAAAGTLGGATSLVNALPEAAAPAVDLATDALDATVTTIITAPVVAATLTEDAVGGVTEATSGIAGGVASLLGDDPGGLTGADPAAGVTTLVGMVTASDVFQLNDNGDAPVLEPALGALGAADVLAEAHPAESLLGIADNDHGGLLGGGHDDDHGLLGLG